MQYNNIEYVGGSSEPALNVTDSVGFKGANKPDDVMLIQAMIALICRVDKRWVGLDEPGYSIPAVTGEIDADTYTAISQFQIKNKDRLLMSMFDGRIDPAHYKGRHLHTGMRKLMSITLLHQMTTDASVLLGLPTDDPSDNLSYRGGLVQLHPMMKSKINTARDMHVIEVTD